MSPDVVHRLQRLLHHAKVKKKKNMDPGYNDFLMQIDLICDCADPGEHWSKISIFASYFGTKL